ncbi:MAG: phenylacetic acid degradation bifunctional protein PaaZ [Proteobacteria bacterium]|nr:phenylacetic acid degradation bifunctional protein PaaZ [Pseudomonadota bacterium]
MDIPVLQSYLADQWFGREPLDVLLDASSGVAAASTHAEKPDFAAGLHHARRQGVHGLLALDFQERAQRLKQLSKHLSEHKEELYAWSTHTGATRADGWIDIEGGIATLSAYASLGSNELPSGNVLHEGPVVSLGRKGHFVGSHILVPREGVAVHIDAFNFPIWGLLEKFAPSFLAGMPCIAKPATSTSYLTWALVRRMLQWGGLPVGSLQLVIGSTGDLLDRLDGQDIVTFTGSAATAAKLRANPNLLSRGVPFNAEADSLNSAILAPDVKPEDAEFELFAEEIVREMRVKAGQKCTAIRRIMVPRRQLEALSQRLREKLSKIVVGDPRSSDVQMGPLASKAQQADVLAQLQRLRKDCATVYDGGEHPFAPGAHAQTGAFVGPTLLLCERPSEVAEIHDVEVFGPVSTLLPYDDMDEALELAARGQGSLVATIATRDAATASHAVRRAAVHHGRVLILDAQAAQESTGHGAPLPMLKHGGPGRAGGGEELGGLRAVTHYLQRTAVQGSPSMVAAVVGEYIRGAARIESDVHPFRRHFEELQIGESLLTHRRTVTEADIVAFGGISGDYFYMHFDEIAARQSPFGQRIAHGYFVLSAAAGLFVSPAPGPVLANYGLDTLRFIKPVRIGDTIRARLTCKRKTDRRKTDAQGRGQGVVTWDVEVRNQDEDLVASYDILTLVAKRNAD